MRVAEPSIPKIEDRCNSSPLSSSCTVTLLAQFPMIGPFSSPDTNVVCSATKAMKEYLHLALPHADKCSDVN